jgi:hypothetical protein
MVAYRFCDQLTILLLVKEGLITNFLGVSIIQSSMPAPEIIRDHPELLKH